MQNPVATAQPGGGGGAASPLEVNVREVIALIDAISVGKLFARPPPGSTGAAKHATGEALLEVVRKRLVDGLEIAKP